MKLRPSFVQCLQSVRCALLASILVAQGDVACQYLYGNWPQYTLGVIPWGGVEKCTRAAGDMNEDGISDVVVSPGQNLTLTHYAMPGHVMVAAASTGAPPVILGNLGRFWLDPANLVLLTPLAIGSSGNAALTLPVPPDPRLRGQTVWTQAIDIEGTPPFAARLTNAVWNRIQ